MSQKMSEMTSEELLEVIKDVKDCGACSECSGASARELRDDEDNKVTCNEAQDVAIEILICRFEEMIERPKNEKPTEEVEKEPLAEPFYQSTVSFMKKSGYTKCYMCGAELK